MTARIVRAAFLGNSLPRQCGIATFTTDLTNAIAAEFPGVDRIVLLQCERGVVRWDSDRATKSMERLTRIVRAAASQSRRVWLPSLVGPLEAAGFLAAQPDAALCEPAGPGLAASEPLPGCLVVGPEGGFSPAELGACHHRVSLGPTILRVETAAVAAAAQWTALCPIDHGA